MTDKEIIINITKEMGLAQTGDQITKHWHNDAVWYDLQFHLMKGLSNCRNEFTDQFNGISNVKTDFLEIDAYVDGKVGFVRSVQRFMCDDKYGNPESCFLTRQTDCYIKENDKWQLIHQHVSLPTDFSTGKAIFKKDL